MGSIPTQAKASSLSILTNKIVLVVQSCWVLTRAPISWDGYPRLPIHQWWVSCLMSLSVKSQHVCVWLCARVSVCARVRACVCVCMFVCAKTVKVCVCVSARACVHACMRVCVCVCVRVCVCMCIQTLCLCVCACVCCLY
jgi:hypothetical protein